MLVIHHQQRRARPHLRVALDCHVNLSNQQLPRLYVMVGVLIVGDFFSTVGVVVVIVRLDKRILGNIPLLQSLRNCLYVPNNSGWCWSRFATSIVELVVS